MRDFSSSCLLLGDLVVLESRVDLVDGRRPGRLLEPVRAGMPRCLATASKKEEVRESSCEAAIPAPTPPVTASPATVAARIWWDLKMPKGAFLFLV